MFTKIKHTRGERLEETYCDGAQHVAVVHPAHPHSGEPLELSASPCACPPVSAQSATSAEDPTT